MFPTTISLDGHDFVFLDGTPDPYVKDRFYFLGHANRYQFRESQAQRLMDEFCATLDGVSGDRFTVLHIDRVTQRTSTAAVQRQARNITPGNSFYAVCVQFHRGVKID